MTTPVHRGRWSTVLWLLLVAAATAAPFLPVLRNGFVPWDDDQLFLENARYRGLSPRHLVWMFSTTMGGHYHPLSWLTLGADYLLWGMDPSGYHLTSLLLHVMASLAFFLVIRLLLRHALGLSPGETPPGLNLACAVGTLCFSVHPLRVESVAWVTERRDVLSGLLWMLSVYAYLRRHGARGTAQARWYEASLIFFTLSLLSKAWAVTLPLLLLILDAYPLGRAPRGSGGRRWAGLVAEKIPYLVLAAAAAGLALAAQQRQGALQPLAVHALSARAAQAAYALCFYLRKALVPLHLSPLYLLRGPPALLQSPYLPCAAAMLLVTALLVAGRRRAPWALAAWLAFVVIVSPVLGFAQSGPQIAADRYTYLAMLPFAVLVAAGLFVLGRLCATGRLAARWWHAGAEAVCAVLVLFGVLTFRQTRVWKDGRSLWEHAVRLDPSNPIALNNRGNARRGAGDTAGALADYQTALLLDPAYAEAYNNRGNIREERGDADGALADYDAAIRANPGWAVAHFNRGNLLFKHGQLAAAIASYTSALEQDPEEADAYLNRAACFERLGALDVALADLENALACAPQEWAPRGDVMKAVARFRQAGVTPVAR